MKIPDFNNILGDKLSAYAPNTTGIPYLKKNKEMGQEILKQMFDIGCLFDVVDNLQIVSEVFKKTAEMELQYRDKKSSIDDILEDILETSLSFCLRQNTENTNFNILLNGISRVRPFIFSQSFHLEIAFGFAAKAAYLATLIKYECNEIERFQNADISNFIISAPLNTKLNKLKKQNEDAFFYFYKINNLARR